MILEIFRKDIKVRLAVLGAAAIILLPFASGNSEANIDVTFNHVAHVTSSKDIPHVILVDCEGNELKIDDLDGHTGDFSFEDNRELQGIFVKSGTTNEFFLNEGACDGGENPPPENPPQPPEEEIPPVEEVGK